MERSWSARNVTLDGVVQDPTSEERFRHGAGSPRFGTTTARGGPRSGSTEVRALADAAGGSAEL